MQQALEAMEYADACLKKQLTTKTKHEYAQDLLLEAGTALRERLAQPNEFEPDWDQVEALQESLREHMAEIHRLRQWQGLTDQEINSVCYKRDWTAPWTNTAFARAIEAKLREKNHGH